MAAVVAVVLFVAVVVLKAAAALKRDPGGKASMEPDVAEGRVGCAREGTE